MDCEAHENQNPNPYYQQQAVMMDPKASVHSIRSVHSIHQQPSPYVQQYQQQQGGFDPNLQQQFNQPQYQQSPMQEHTNTLSQSQFNQQQINQSGFKQPMNQSFSSQSQVQNFQPMVQSGYKQQDQFQQQLFQGSPVQNLFQVPVQGYVQSPYQQQMQSPLQQQQMMQQCQPASFLQQGSNLMLQNSNVLQQFQQTNQIQFPVAEVPADDGEDDEFQPQAEEGSEESSSDGESIDQDEIQEEEEFDDPDFNLEEYLKVRDQL